METKTLILLRHAKSSWQVDQLDDHDRPLNNRGRKAATRIGRLLADEAINVDSVLCSTSVRTRETADLVFAEFKKPPTISYRDDLYHASPDQIVKILAEAGKRTKSVMVIGHNPGFEVFLEQLTGEAVPFPTAALALLELNIEDWKQCNNQTRGTLKQMWRPKELDDN